jgi:hypothetical protein
MATRSKWVIEDETKNQIIRASTIKPRLDYATETVDDMLEILMQKKRNLNESNLMFYRMSDGTAKSLKVLESKVLDEVEISYAIESLRQVRRSLDSIAGMGNVPTGLAPTISIDSSIKNAFFTACN